MTLGRCQPSKCIRWGGLQTSTYIPTPCSHSLQETTLMKTHDGQATGLGIRYWAKSEELNGRSAPSPQENPQCLTASPLHRTWCYELSLPCRDLIIYTQNMCALSTLFHLKNISNILRSDSDKLNISYEQLGLTWN